MNPWRPFPLIRLIIPVVAGTVTALFLRKDIHVPVVLIFILLCPYAGIIFIRKFSTGYRLRWLPGALILLLMFLIPYEITIRKNELFSSHYFFGKSGKSPCLFLAEIIEPPSAKTKTIKVVVRIHAADSNGSWMKTSGKALIYIQKDPRSDKLQFGDKLIFRCAFHEPPPAAFPFSFDQKIYLGRKQIYHTAYVGSGNWSSIQDKEFSLQRFALQIRNRLLEILKENDVHGREFAVASALLLGYVDQIDRELIRDYSATGAMHILSVSGMHVGIIFLVLDRLLSFLRRTRPGNIFRTFLIIAIIWFYAMLTGLSPAVMRASVMITFVVAGKAMKREPDILNIVAASFIILIIHDPTLLTDAGFEMSYLAVAGIVLLYKPIYDLYITSWYIPDKVWAILAVSLAAQLVTFPLGLYYFHQFPNYFMLANIIVVPLSTLIIYSGILLLFFGSVPVVSLILAKALTGLVWVMNQTLHLIEEMPLAVTKGVFITPAMTVLIYLVLISVLIFLISRRKKYFFFFLCLMIILQLIVIIRSSERSRSRAIIVYGDRKITGIEFVKGNRSILIYSEDSPAGTFFGENRQATLNGLGVCRDIRLIFRPNPAVKRDVALSGWFYIQGNYILFDGKRIGIVDRKFPALKREELMLDYLIIRGNPDISIPEILKVFRTKVIIADPTNAGWRVRKWKGEAGELGVKFFDVNAEGAFFAKFD